MTLITKGMGAIIKLLPRSKKVSPDIKSVKPTKNIKEINKHKEAIQKGEEAKKKIQRMKDIKRAYSIGKYDAPSDPGNPPKK